MHIKLNSGIAGSLLVLAAVWSNGANAYDTLAFSNPEAYLEKSFVTSSLPAKLLNSLPPSPLAKPPARSIRVILVHHTVGAKGKKEDIEFSKEFTFLGGGIIREYLQRPKLHFAAYELSYGNLLPLRTESLTYTRPRQGLILSKTISVSHMDPFPPAPGKKSSMTYVHKSYGLPPDSPVTFDCSYIGTRDAKLISSNITGKAIDFRCDIIGRGKKFARIDSVYLQDYGLYLDTSTETFKGALFYPSQSTIEVKKFEMIR